MKKCVAIYNPISGFGIIKKSLKEIEEVIKSYNYDVKLIETEYSKHAYKIIQEIEADLVISFGGDGTFNEVMNGNMKREKRLLLSHIPVGTTNDLGSMFGYTKNIIKNLHLLLEGVVKNIDICKINNDNAFVYALAFGKFADIPYETPQNLKNMFGRVAYVLEIIKTLFYRIKKYDITYTIDGIKRRGKYSLIIVSNANRIAGINDFYHDILLDDDKFEVMFCSITKLTELAKAFFCLKTSDIHSVSGIEIYKTNNLNIKFNDIRSVRWCVDGERFDTKTKKFDISIEKDIKVRIPNTNIDKLFKEK